jgi:hypothetical protein
MESDRQRAKSPPEEPSGERKTWGEGPRAERHPAPPGGRAPRPAEKPPRSDEDERVDEESAASFPASDPPSFNPVKIG